MGVWGQDEVSDCQKMAIQNRALRGEGNCDEHCTVVVAIRLRPIAATWAWWGWRGWCMGGRGGGVSQTHSPIEVLQLHRALADLEVDLVSRWVVVGRGRVGVGGSASDALPKLPFSNA